MKLEKNTAAVSSGGVHEWTAAAAAATDMHMVKIEEQVKVDEGYHLEEEDIQ